MRYSERERARYKERKRRLDNSFKWTKKRAANFRALNDALTAMQDKLVAQMRRAAEVFGALEKGECPFLRGFRIVGEIFFEPEICFTYEKYDNQDDIPEKLRKEMNKWDFLCFNTESEFWRLIYDSETGDFLSMSKVLMNMTEDGWLYDFPENADGIKVCSFLHVLHETAPFLTLQDLCVLTEKDFWTRIRVETVAETPELYAGQPVLYDYETPVQKLLYMRHSELERGSFEWNEQNIQKILDVNAMLWKRTNEIKRNMTTLAVILSELGKTDPLFAEFDIGAEIHYKTEKPTDIASAEIQRLLTENTRFSFWTLRINSDSWDGTIGDSVHDDDRFNWNFERYRKHLTEEQQKIKFHYFMHFVFIDGCTYTFADLLRMEEEGFVGIYDICLNS